VTTRFDLVIRAERTLLRASGDEAACTVGMAAGRVTATEAAGSQIRLAEALAWPGLKACKISTHAFPEPQQIIRWPLFAALSERSARRRG
jgi:hypothetical protein